MHNLAVGICRTDTYLLLYYLLYKILHVTIYFDLHESVFSIACTILDLLLPQVSPPCLKDLSPTPTHMFNGGCPLTPLLRPARQHQALAYWQQPIGLALSWAGDHT